jgi:hypothetical protein
MVFDHGTMEILTFGVFLRSSVVRRTLASRNFRLTSFLQGGEYYDFRDIRYSGRPHLSKSEGFADDQRCATCKQNDQSNSIGLVRCNRQRRQRGNDRAIYAIFDLYRVPTMPLWKWVGHSGQEKSLYVELFQILLYFLHSHGRYLGMNLLWE